MATAHVQSYSNTATSNASPTFTFTSNVTAGNLIAGHVAWDSTSATLNSITDGLGNTYTRVDNPTTGVVMRACMFYAMNITGGACTVTFNFSVAVVSLVSMQEVSGCATTNALDVHAIQAQSNLASGTDVASSTAATTTQSGDYIFGGIADIVQGGAWTAGTGYTRDAAGHAEPGNGSTASEYLANQGSAGSTTVTFSTAVTGMYPITGIMAFKAAGGASGANAQSTLTMMGVQ